MDKNKFNALDKIVRELECLARDLEVLGLEKEMEQLCQIVYQIDFDYLGTDPNS